MTEPAYPPLPCDPFPDAHKRGQLCVIAQLGQSLDGRIALENGRSRHINGQSALKHLHALRAHVDGVLIGVATALTDNPHLTVRTVAGKNPARLVLDPSLKLAEAEAPQNLFHKDGTQILIIHADDLDAEGMARRARLTSAYANISLLGLPRTQNIIAPQHICAALYQRGMRRLLVEGGAKTIGLFLEAGCVDSLQLLLAPIILGSGKSGLCLPPILDLDEALRPDVRHHDLGDGEMLVDCRFPNLRC